MLALFGILAVAFTAATLPTAVDPERPGQGGSGPPGAGDGGSGFGGPLPEGSPGATVEIPFLTELLALLAALALVALLAYLFVHWRRVFRAVAVLVGLFVAFWLFFQVFSPEPSTVVPPSLEPLPANGSSGGGDPDAVTDPTFAAVVAVLALVVTLLGTVLAVRRRTSDRDRPAPADAEGDEAVRRAVGRAAGRAAERIEGSDDADNEVYRAWREMTELLDVSRPETNTSGEFETAAVDAGMEPADVRELTELFELVRYGGHDLDQSDERRAVELLERIETRYGVEEP